MNIGYVGLGNMGGALARRLQLTHPLVVYDLSEAARQALVARGASACASLAEMAPRCDVILLCLPTSDHVRTALFGPDGLASGLKPGTLVIDQTSGDPVATRAMAEELARQGVELVDAPVSGGMQGAEAGTIAIMVGATEEQFARMRPLLNAISPNVFHAGGIGAGQVIKLVNNMMSSAIRLVTYEGVALAAKNGIDPRKACEILSAGGAKNSFLDKFMGPHVVQGNLGSGFSLGLMNKDLRLACQLGTASQVPLFAGNLTRDFYQMSMNSLGADAHLHAVAVTMDQVAGTQVVPPGTQTKMT